MYRVALVAAVVTLQMLVAATVHAADLKVTPPATPPSEDSAFPIVVSGNTDFIPYDTGRLWAKIRPAGAPCAPLPDDDSGNDVNGINDYHPFGRSVEGMFSYTGSKVLSTAGTYVICAWLGEGSTIRYGPVSATVTVRRPQLAITLAAPSRVYVNHTFPVSVKYFAEVQRDLSVIVARASSCSISSEGLLGIASSYWKVVDDERVSGSATIDGSARFDAAGRYVVCGFFETFSSGAAQYAVQGPTVVVKRVPKFRSCRRVGGRRNIRRVRAKIVTCTGARKLARRWGKKPRRKIRGFTCKASFPSVNCASGSRRVRFRFSRRT